MRREVCANGSGITGAKLVFFLEGGLFYIPGSIQHARVVLPPMQTNKL
jgi:hypothetical protein